MIIPVTPLPSKGQPQSNYMATMTVVDEEWDVAPGPKGDEVNVFAYDLTTLDSYNAEAYAQADMLHIEVEISGVGGDPSGNSPYYAQVYCNISKDFESSSDADIPFTDGHYLATDAVLRGARTLFRTGEVWLSWKRPADERTLPAFFFVADPLHVYLNQQFAGGDGITVHVRVTGYKL